MSQKYNPDKTPISPGGTVITESVSPEDPIEPHIPEQDPPPSNNDTPPAAKDPEEEKPVKPEQNDNEGSDDSPRMPDFSKDEAGGNGDSWGNKGGKGSDLSCSEAENFLAENMELIKKIKNILDFVYPNSGITLAELITAAKKYICMYAKGPDGNGVDTTPDPDEVDPLGNDNITEPIPNGESPDQQEKNDEDYRIAKGFCIIYNTDLDEFAKVVNSKLFRNEEDIFKSQPIEDQKDFPSTNAINAEFHEQDEVRKKQLIKAVNAIVEALKSNIPDEEYNKKTIIMPLVNYCKKDKNVVLNYIQYLLKVFFDKWLLPDGSGDRFPYVINTLDGHYYEKSGSNDSPIYDQYEGQDVGPRKGKFVIPNEKGEFFYKIEKDNEPKKLKQKYEKWNPELKHRNSKLISDNWVNLLKIVNSVVEKYNKNTKGVVINNKQIKDIKGDGKNYIIVLEDESTLKCTPNNFNDCLTYDNNNNLTFDYQLYYGGGDESKCIVGKSAPSTMKELSKELYKEYKKLNSESKTKLEALLKLRYPKVHDFDENNPGKNYNFKDYLHDYGIGMECSGYVSRALAYLMSELHVPIYYQFKTLGIGYQGRLKTNAYHLKGTSKLYFKKNSESSSKTELKDVFSFYGNKALQPGDIIMKNDDESFHIRIVYEVNKDQSYFREHESASGYLSRSDARIGIVQTKVVSQIKNAPITSADTIPFNEMTKTYTENITEAPYWFARPYVFKDSERLKNFFIDMLKSKGSS